MGGRQTKIEGSYLPETPVTDCKTLKTYRSTVCNNRTDLDPRSPAECRTPIETQSKASELNAQIPCDGIPRRDYNEKTLDVLRKRFFKSFTYNLNDPRSPSLNLNRTPIVLDDTLEKPLSLDDTFSNLFVDSHFPKSSDIVGQIERVSDDNVQKEGMNINLNKIETEQQTPIVLQQEFDPRSPSMGVERTPIIFTDDEVDETTEDVMLENILATLSIDMNSCGNISVISNNSQDENILSNKVDSPIAPLNKHLDRVRTGKKISLKSKLHKPTRRTKYRKIYEDQENYLPLTPIFKTRQPDKNHLKSKRTPLSCVRNRNDTYFRSRSVESSAKSLKTRLTLKSFDDTLNHTEHNNVPIMGQGSQDFLDLN